MILPKDTLLRIAIWIATKFGLQFDFDDQWSIVSMNENEVNEQLHYGRDR